MRTATCILFCAALLLGAPLRLSWAGEGNLTAAGKEPEAVVGGHRDEPESQGSSLTRNDPKERDRMKRWRNVMCPESESDAEIRAIDALEDRLGAILPNVERIRALLSRIDPLSHYKAFENIEFIARAIGALDYPGSPAIDVLWRHGQIDDERRAEAKRYIYCIGAWLDGRTAEEAKAERADCSALVGTLYTALGEMDDSKRWLAMSMVKTLKEHAYTPWDFIAEHGDGDFVSAVYRSILGRDPSPDDLKFRVEELKGGKSREQLFLEVFNSQEHKTAQLRRVSQLLKREATPAPPATDP